MGGKYHYGITADALDELGRLEYMSAFVADAISCIADSVERDGAVTNKCWQGLYYISEIISEKIAEIHSQCGKNEPAPHNGRGFSA